MNIDLSPWERMRGTYWAVPSAMAAVSVVLSLVMIDVDQALTATFLSQLSWVYTGGPEGARAVLSTIAASMITVAGVTFSITIVALTLASQQFLNHNSVFAVAPVPEPASLGCGLAAFAALALRHRSRAGQVRAPGPGARRGAGG